MISLLRKSVDWCRIGLAVHKLNRVEPSEREYAQQALTHALADARGLAMKIGQFMAGVDDTDNPYHQLIVSIKPLPLSRLKPVMEAQFMCPLEKLFQSVDEATAAASLGQVHHAVRHDGREVAIKIRYPGIVDAVKAELTISNWLPEGGPIKRWRINTANYKNILRRQLLRETDYLVEMQTQQRFRHNIKVAGLQIPEIHTDLCSDAVLVQSWENGYRFNEACTWSQKDRLEIGRTLLMTLFHSLFIRGEVHGDPHSGNYLFRHDKQGNTQTVLLDFGCTVLINRESRMALLKLIAFFRGEPGFQCDPLSCFVAMGFDAEKLSHLQNDLPQICELLLKPFLANRPFPINQWYLSAELKSTLDERRWWFRSAGPAELFLLLRAFHGLSQQLEKLDAALPWWPLLQHVVGDQLLDYARTMELTTVETLASTPKSSYGRARKLCVRLTENDVVRISVDLPAESAFELQTIIPGQVLLLLLSSSDVDFATLSQRLKKEGLLPQQLFDLKIDAKQCRLWLE